jgi:DNA-binding GntR family transcriptional regulator
MATAAFSNKRLQIPQLSKETLQEQVFRHVTELILDGSIVPGEMVTVQSLADAFGVSPMPVREALRRLTAANALTVISGRSIGIPRISLERLNDLRDVRSEIEAIAAGWAAERRDDSVIGHLAKHLEEMEKSIAAGNVKGYLRGNYAFHFAIYRAAGSDNLLKIIENLWLQISPYFNMLHGSYRVANEHHQEMFLAMKDREVEAVRKAVKADISAAYQVLTRLVE